MLSISSMLIKASSGASLFMQQTRNTFVLKRRWPLPLCKKGSIGPKLRARHFIYDLVQDTNVLKKPDVTVILKQFVDGIGKAGDVVTLRPSVAYKEYLVPGIAMYASPENITKHKIKETDARVDDSFSSPYVHRYDTFICGAGLATRFQPGHAKPRFSSLLKWYIGNEGGTYTLGVELCRLQEVPNISTWWPGQAHVHVKCASTFGLIVTYNETMGCLSRLVLQVTMSKLEPWTLEPWHIKTSFRKAGFVVPEQTIEMPPVTIKGPDLSLQEKEFYVTVTINKTEKVNVRCRIHHWATGLDRLPWEEFHWNKPLEALLPEQAAVLENMPLPE